MKKAILVAIIGAMTLGVNAGDWGKAPVGKAPIVECYDIGGEISTGYMSDYIFYGARFAKDSVWVDVNYTFDNLAVPITVGVWYLNGIRPVGVDELDLYVSAALGSFAGFDVSLGYTHYFFPETAGSPNLGEIGLDISRSLGFVDFVAEINWIEYDAWYYQFGLEKTIAITDAVSLVLGAGVSYSDGYYANSAGYGGNSSGNFSNWNHYYLTAALPIQLNCRTTLSPYIGWNGSPDGWVTHGLDTSTGLGAQADDILHGGVSLSVTF